MRWFHPVSKVVFILASLPVFAVEHPGTIGTAVCTSCHADKVSAKSVHSAMETSCTVCHVMRSQGDMTTMNLAMPRERICSACHVETEERKRHQGQTPAGLCLTCHDAHSSNQRMLLRVVEALPAHSKNR